MCIPHFIYTSVHGLLSCFHLLTSMSKASVNVSVHISVQVFAFTSFLCIFRSGITGSMVILVFGFFWGTSRLLSKMGCTILHCHQKCTQVPVFPHPHQQLELPVCLIFKDVNFREYAVAHVLIDQRFTYHL